MTEQIKGKRPQIADPVAHFWANVDQSGGADACWPWTMSIVKTTGYGQFNTKATGRWSSHRFAFEQAKGEVPAGYLVDHTCHNEDTSCPGGKTCAHRRCCNPAHLEAIPSHRENQARARAPRKIAQFAEKCANGHAWNEENTGWNERKGSTKHRDRYCRACAREKAYKRHTGQDRPVPADVSLSRKGTPVCGRGHEYTPENTKYDSTTGKRRCIACERINDQNSKARKRAAREGSRVD